MLLPDREEALSDWLAEHDVKMLGRPSADIVEWPNEKDFSGDLTIAVEVDVRPDFDLPDYEGIELTVDSVEISDDEVEEELSNLRTRFGTLVTVEHVTDAAGAADYELGWRDTLAHLGPVLTP